MMDTFACDDFTSETWATTKSEENRMTTARRVITRTMLNILMREHTQLVRAVEFTGCISADE